MYLGRTVQKPLATGNAMLSPDPISLAQAIHVEGSTVSQLISETTAHLQNAQVIGVYASALNVSAD